MVAILDAAGNIQDMKKIILAAVVVVLGVVVVLALLLAGTYNNFVGLSQAVDKQWAQVQNVYQRRADLVPNLVNTVSGAANFEKSTLTEVVNARASVGKVQINPSQAPATEEEIAKF